MLGVALGSLAAHAQVQTEAPPPVPGAKPVTVERIKVHGAALEGNLEGNAADRDVLVVLPPSYAKEKSRRYPVVYALHGYSIGAEQWSREIHVPQTIEGAFAQGAKEMIVVLPDSKTVHNGSMYSSSVTTGDFERFIARDLVAYIDAHYRTMPQSREPRPRRPLDGRLRRDAHRHEARRRVRQPLHHEPVLPVGPRRRPRSGGAREDAGGGEDAGGFREAAVLRARATGCGVGLVAQSEESAALSRSADEGRRAASGGAGALGRQRAAGVRRPVHRRASYLPAIAMDVGDQDGLRTDAGKLHEVFDTYGLANTLRDLPRHPHEQGRRSLPEPRPAVLQPDLVCREGLSIERFDRT